MPTTEFPLVSYQPFRFLFQLTYISTIILRLPYYIIRSLIPSLRPNASWTFKQTFMTRLLYPYLDILSRISVTETLSLEPGKEGARWQIVKPSTLDVYKGPLVSTITKPATVGGTWYPAAPEGGFSSKKIFLYYHGGAFIEGDGRTAMYGPIAKRMLKKGGADAVFAVQYRLSGHAGLNPFPAALQDAVSSYLYLLNDLNIPADQIVMIGDSAGGNLILALLRYIHDFGTETDIPNPKCAVLLSPWVAPFLYEMDDNPNRGTDFIPTTYPTWGANAYAGNWPNARSDPYITHLGNPFPCPVPMFVNVGTAEMISDHILEWAQEMLDVRGNELELYYEEGAVHDTLFIAEMIGFEKTAWEVAKKFGEFVDKL
ncbi:alpha/beta hydrolase fold-3 domain-containing protein [Xylariaceae sp. FL1019]|nr:alpha/beta hydrolase fold-3 domain-containing protein [Xylariaceae sp. FL1019]